LIRGVLYNDINTELLRASDGALNKKGVEAFFSLLEQRKTPLAVFDLSNAWSKKYLGPQNTAELAQILSSSPVAKPDSIFVVTDYQRNQFYKNGERAKSPWFTTQAKTHETNSHSFFKILNSSLPKGSSLNEALFGCDALLLP
jgi:hypothetical protein